MENSNAVKADLLGMPFGTANAKLKKKLLFHLADRLEMLECFRCQDTIESLEDFSIEHTESWRFAENPIEAFFDVEKIAFSHLDCNIKAPKSGSSSLKKEVCQHGHFYSSSVKDEKYRDGVRSRCKECHAELQRKYRSLK